MCLFLFSNLCSSSDNSGSMGGIIAILSPFYCLLLPSGEIVTWLQPASKTQENGVRLEGRTFHSAQPQWRNPIYKLIGSSGKCSRAPPTGKYSKSSKKRVSAHYCKVIRLKHVACFLLIKRIIYQRTTDINLQSFLCAESGPWDNTVISVNTVERFCGKSSF